MQRQVGEPRTGREEKWYFEIYRESQPGPAEFGDLFDFEDVKRKITIKGTSNNCRSWQSRTSLV